MMATCVDALMTTPFPKRDRPALHSGTPPRDEESQCKKETGAKCPRSRWLIEWRCGLCAALVCRERGLYDEPAGMRVDHADRAQREQRQGLHRIAHRDRVVGWSGERADQSLAQRTDQRRRCDLQVPL